MVVRLSLDYPCSFQDVSNLSPLLTEKKNPRSLKVENYVLFGGLSEDSSLGNNLSESSEGCSKEVREESEYVGVFATKTR